MARPIRHIVVHCSYTPPSRDVGAVEIRRWHVDERGWQDIGYHYVIRRDGTVEPGRPVEQPGAHARGYNGFSIGICLAGGMAEDDRRPDCNFTRPQWAALQALVGRLAAAHPDAAVVGHRDLDPKKACPTFDVGAWWGPDKGET